ncbi:MAG TPA: hypothetical protein V6C85_03185, partial [Allocoleopsis sp.]
MSSFPTPRQKSITRETLIHVALRIAGVIVVSTTISYFHTFSSIKSEALDRVAKYVTERGQRERSIFTLAVDNHAVLKQAVLQQLQELSDRDPQEEFDRLFVRWTDGVIRNRPKDQRPEDFDTQRYSAVFIDKRLTLNADIRRRVVTFYNLT